MRPKLKSVNALYCFVLVTPLPFFILLRGNKKCCSLSFVKAAFQIMKKILEHSTYISISKHHNIIIQYINVKPSVREQINLVQKIRNYTIQFAAIYLNIQNVHNTIPYTVYRECQ